jgi:hypothetical protein
MSDRLQPTPPPDVILLLRAHAEQRWLSREVVPVLREVEFREGLLEERFAAALAYLEVAWCEAQCLARETDRARRALVEASAGIDERLRAKAHRYHDAVAGLREAVRRRVVPLIVAPADDSASVHARR